MTVWDVLLRLLCHGFKITYWVRLTHIYGQVRFYITSENVPLIIDCRNIGKFTQRKLYILSMVSDYLFEFFAWIGLHWVAI